MGETGDGSERAELHELFEAELRAARIDVSGDDRERLWIMWERHFPQRQALREAALTDTEDPTFIQKPTTLAGRS